MIAKLCYLYTVAITYTTAKKLRRAMSSSPLSFSMESILQSVPSVRKPDSNGLSRKLLCNASSNTAAAMQEEQGNQTLQYSPSSVKSAPSCSPFYQSALQEFSSGMGSNQLRHHGTVHFGKIDIVARL